MVFYHVCIKLISNGLKGHAWYFQNKTKLKHTPRNHTHAHAFPKYNSAEGLIRSLWRFQCGIWAVMTDRRGYRRCDCWTAAEPPTRTLAAPVSSTGGVIQRDVRPLWGWSSSLLGWPHLAAITGETQTPGGIMLLSPTAGFRKRKTKMGLWGEKSCRYFLN